MCPSPHRCGDLLAKLNALSTDQTQEADTPSLPIPPNLDMKDINKVHVHVGDASNLRFCSIKLTFCSIISIAFYGVTHTCALYYYFHVCCRCYLTFALQEWYIEKVKGFCRVPGVSGDVCAALLSPLNVDDVTNIIEDPDFPLVHTYFV